MILVLKNGEFDLQNGKFGLKKSEIDLQNGNLTCQKNIMKNHILNYEYKKNI